jgi:hypothetical protein
LGTPNSFAWSSYALRCVRRARPEEDDVPRPAHATTVISRALEGARKERVQVLAVEDRPPTARPAHHADVIVRLQALATRLGFPVTFGDAADLA